MTDKTIQNDFRKITTADLDLRCGAGWKNIIYSALGCIEFHCRTNPGLHTKVSCIKEKFGSLRIYLYPTDRYLDGIVAMANEMSLYTCDICGKEGKLLKSGCARVRCSDCKDK